MSTEFTPLKLDEVQLFELARLSNISIDERIFKILLELLKLNVKPEAIIQVLKVLAKQNQANSSWMENTFFLSDLSSFDETN